MADEQGSATDRVGVEGPAELAWRIALRVGILALQRTGLRAVTGFGALAGAAASVALVVFVIQADPQALFLLGLLVLIAVFGRPVLLRHVKRERPS